MNSHFGYKSDGRNVLMYFQPHGSKDWGDLKVYAHPEDWAKKKSECQAKSVIILHDQEPFDRQLLDIYRDKYSKKNKNNYWRKYQTIEETLLYNQFQTIGWPIICHSEWQSDDIAFAESSGMITCHYFYHGLIARDWFRHWKHHGEISNIKNWQWRFLLYARGLTGSRQYRKSLINDLTPLKSMIDYDWDQNKNISSDYSAKISVTDAGSSAIHLVAETIFTQEKIHLTEKIFKPMVMMQPFILFAGAGSLKYLTKYGFKTFGDIWDESYDLESDYNCRYKKILNLIYDLSKLSDKQVNDLLVKCQPIIEHNQQHFFSDQFEEILLDELRSNMENSLEQQDEKIKRFPGGSCLYQFDKLIKLDVELPPAPSQNLKDILSYLKQYDIDRFDGILRQHSWLRGRGFV